MNFHQRNEFIARHEDDALNAHLDRREEEQNDDTICPKCGELKVWDEDICKKCQEESNGHS